MGLTDLKTNNLLEIFEYFSSKELVILEGICKTFRNVFIKNIHIFHKKFINEFGLQSVTNSFNYKNVLMNIQYSKFKHPAVYFLPYYTDSGIYMNSEFYNVGNLVSEDRRVYCSNTPKNVLVKFILTNLSQYDYSRKLLEQDFQQEVIFNDLEEKENEFNNKIGYITFIYFGRIFRGFTTPIKTAAFFSSVEKIQDFSVIKKFYDCTNKDSLLEKSTELGFKFEEIENSDYFIAMFNQKNKVVNVHAWITVKTINFEDTIKIDLKEGVFARYFYALLIKSDILNPQHSNIDCNIVAPFSKIIRLR